MAEWVVEGMRLMEMEMSEFSHYYIIQYINHRLHSIHQSYSYITLRIFYFPATDEEEEDFTDEEEEEPSTMEEEDSEESEFYRIII